MRFATYTQDRGTGNGSPARAGVVSDAGIHPLPEDATVLALAQAGLPAALAAGDRALGGPAVPVAAVRLLPPLEAPTVRDFVAFEEHVEGMAAGGGGTVPEQWYQAPTFYFT
ncbi:MAG TPA: fumarylacetoacetate hydrolase family protein, partial [Trebonia sp.]